MKKIFGLVFAFLWVSMMGFTQDNYLDMKFGVGMPVGNFSENGLDGKGYAGTGFMMSFEGNYFLGTIGFTGDLTYNMNFLDDVALQGDLTDRLHELFPDANLPPDALTQFVTSQWSSVHLVVGPVLSIPVSVIRFEMRAMGGLSFVMPPAWQLYIESGVNKLHTVSSGQSVKLAYMVGAGILYRTAGSYGVRLGLDYLGTNTGFTVNYSYSEGVTESPYQKIKKEIPVNMFQATLGIMYAF